jgi:hypothetical protein
MTRQISPVRVRGVTYPSAQACADHFKIKRSAVYYALEKGKVEALGLEATRGQRKSFTYKELTWASMAEASKALGLNRLYVSRALSGNCRERELLQGHLAAYHEGRIIDA